MPHKKAPAPRTQSNTDRDEDFLGRTSVAPSALIREDTGNPLDHAEDMIPQVGSGDDLSSKAPRKGYEQPWPAASGNSRRS